jgi:hypothetical protein
MNIAQGISGRLEQGSQLYGPRPLVERRLEGSGTEIELRDACDVFAITGLHLRSAVNTSLISGQLACPWAVQSAKSVLRANYPAVDKCHN